MQQTTYGLFEKIITQGSSLLPVLKYSLIFHTFMSPLSYSGKKFSIYISYDGKRTGLSSDCVGTLVHIQANNK